MVILHDAPLSPEGILSNFRTLSNGKSINRSMGATDIFQGGGAKHNGHG